MTGIETMLLAPSRNLLTRSPPSRTSLIASNLASLTVPLSKLPKNNPILSIKKLPTTSPKVSSVAQKIKPMVAMAARTMKSLSQSQWNSSRARRTCWTSRICSRSSRRTRPITSSCRVNRIYNKSKSPLFLRIIKKKRRV